MAGRCGTGWWAAIVQAVLALFRLRSLSPPMPLALRSARPRAPRPRALLVLLALAAGTASLGGCARAAAPDAGARTAPPAPPARRAIVVSFDALSERRLFDTVDPRAVPTLRALFADGVCADGARPAFPSLTAPGHSAIWTGAYGNVTGVSGNAQPPLPQPEHTLLETVSGYASEASRAEPIWLTAAAAGRRVFAHHVTQAPLAPGYRPTSGADPRLDALRARAESLLALPHAQVINGYNRELAPSLAITERTAPPRAAAGWRNVEQLESGVAPREIAWRIGGAGDSLYALLHGAARYDRVLVAASRDAAAGVTAEAAPVEQAPLAGRALARHFSPALEVAVPGGRVYVRARLFELSPDGARFLLFMPELQVVEGNRAEVAAAYDAAVQGWYGNSGLILAERGQLGRPMVEGGDGTAELRYLETAELMTRQFMRGVEWAWNTQRPDLLLDYFPGIDEIDHGLYGLVSPEMPGHDAAMARRLQAVRARAWEMADLRLAQLRALAAADPSTALFVSGDHGMRAYHTLFHPNVALREAGLLVADDSGRIDLSRTRALSAGGYWVSVNRTAWKGGIVPPGAAAAVIDSAQRALEAARGADGRPIVTRIWRGSEHDSLGIGGPTGGDLYYDVADGYYYSRALGRTVSTTLPRPNGGHGYPSVRRDMQTVLCAVGSGFPARRLPAARTIDVAPTVAEWLGMPAPLDAVGRSLLSAMRPR